MDDVVAVLTLICEERAPEFRTIDPRAVVRNWVVGTPCDESHMTPVRNALTVAIKQGLIALDVGIRIAMHSNKRAYTNKFRSIPDVLLQAPYPFDLISK